ncbi:DUF2254 domain-containing protein [Stakelama sp. CBK3Z-3]|uniref:DUF2254 domain-containing protein n=1 Tax=Stakelama flava TaxID=2860338 RepID=A0ABS6XPA8_9SPHN|nr:DUF2254 family protein [Stakelama flava]MBW4331260.1 DUF2254 domain-containing protein [Stakelama flava]
MNRPHSRTPAHWIAALLWRSYWGLPTLLVTLAVPLVALLLYGDAAGAGDWLATLGWPFDFGGGVAQELASALVTLYSALVTLYFSISLLVLTLAASNLGVRLIDRWISRRTTRVTLGLLLAGLVWALLALLAIDPDATGARTARLTVTTLALGTVPLLCWLSYALHDLGRTIHVDTAIAALGADTVAEAQPYANRCSSGPDPDWDDGEPVVARRAGYVETIDLRAIAEIARRAGGCFRLEKGQGAFVMAGDTLGTAMDCEARWHGRIGRQFAIGSFRSAPQGAVFYVRLLVEIAARALSPAVNDLYTARACADTLGAAMMAHGALPQAPQWIGDREGKARLLVLPQRFTAIFDAPLAALRQAAAPYPSVASRLLDIYGRVLARDIDPVVRELIVHHRDVLLAHARARAETDTDRRALTQAAQR